MRFFSKPLFQFVQGNLQHLRSALAELDTQQLARQSGFLHRLPRKIPIPKFVLALAGLAAETTLSLERIAAVIGLAAQTTYSKQALHQRLSPQLDTFLAQVAAALFGQMVAPLKNGGWFAAFARVLLQDSTVEPLPESLAAVFPGPANGHKKHRLASLKLQFVCDLLQAKVLHLSLSGFTRNDQSAAPDILKLLQPGDLVIRDLGYFVLKVLEQISLAQAFFLSRYHHGFNLYDRSGQPLDLAATLRPGQGWDAQVLLGRDKLPVRLVALPVSEALANERRRKARLNRDRRLNPSAKHLYLLGWSLFVTNVPPSTWPAKVLPAVYRVRWRIEIIFKAWKSHLGLRQLNCRTANLVRLSVMTKLLFCIAVYRLCDALELMGDHQRHLSLLRLAHILGQCSCWFAATVLGVSLAQWIEWQLRHHAFYEQRNDRKNFYEILAAAAYA